MTSGYPPRQFVQTIAPAAEPVTLAEAKLYLRVDGNEEDRLINDLIQSARQQIEQWLRRSLVTQGWKLSQRFVAGQCLRLSLGPIQMIESVSVILNGQATSLTSD